MIYTTSLDWLQVFCHGEEISSGEYKNVNYTFNVKDSGRETIQFKKLLYIFAANIKVAEIQQLPRTRVINQKATIVKLDNRILYSQQYYEILSAILSTFRLHYKGITRIDVCLDCTELAQGLDVQKFLKRTIKLDESDLGFVYNNGRNHSTYHCTRNSEGCSRINSVKWGSPKSDVTCYCYDKTLELIEQKDKPWIRAMWEKNGLDFAYNDAELYAMSDKQKQRMIKRNGLADYIKKPVWRFEISIKGQGKDVVRLSDGEIFTLGMDDVENQKFIRDIFFAYAKECFDFRENTGQKNRRNFKPMKIFEHIEKETIMPIVISRYQDTGRSEKVCYNKLEKVSHLIDEDNWEMKYHFRKVMEMIHSLSGLKQSLWMAKRNYDMRSDARTFKMMHTDYIDQVIKLHQDSYNLTKDLPTQKEMDMWFATMVEDIPNQVDETPEYWQSLEEICSLMQSPNIVIPELA